MSKSDFPALRMTIEGGRLIPAGPFDQERLNSYRRGTVVFVRFTEEKDRVLIRKWFAVLGLVLKQCETPWKTRDEAHEAIKLALGIVNLSKTVGGQFMQYPKSLSELDDPELTEALDNMIELLSRMTGVDVATLRKETAHVDEERSDPETGEIIEHETPESGSSASEEPVPAEDGAPTVSAASDGDSPSSSDAPPTERETLIKFAKDMLPMAADTSVSPAFLKTVEREWAPLIKELSPEGIAQARAISESLRAIANDPKRLGPALLHYAEVLECTVDEIGGAA
ncbi:hypothetical protein [Rhizobium rhizogenes]|uniref:hypothetical protein n=1 Tax=Rhizobium rhizogenes TaxID=359 RepID=UPI0024BDFB75|nr:hypothetical protein [Rhizobium rhizogenes]MDJ1632294.1 hypothetical protein [Rhizobium rhizogenes]